MYKKLPVLLLATLFFLTACTIQSGPSTSTDNKLCRKEPLAGVYHPTRLTVINPCLTVKGVVDDVRHEKDKDYHIRLKLDPEHKNLLNESNYRRQHGTLVIEVIPMDEPNVPKVRKGDTITVTGAYVRDGKHGWMEIHPAWIVNGQGTTDYTEQAAHDSVQAGLKGNGDKDAEE